MKAALEGKDQPGQISSLFRHIVPDIDRAKHDLAAAVHANVRFPVRKLWEAPRSWPA